MPALSPDSRLHKLYKKLQPHERVLVWLLTGCLLAASLVLAAQLQSAVSTRIPADGGHYREGVVGFPRFANPVLASTNADRDITKLVYAGLMKKGPDGEVVPDLAASMSANNDRTEYTFTIDRQARFHDGHPVTAEDVVFTIERIKDPQINSPRRGQWQSVSVEAVNEKTVRFKTDEPFVGLPSNATVGILPKHLWKSETSRSFAFSELNTKPIGAGPYQVKSVVRNNEGVPSAYKLTDYPEYVGGDPYINRITLRFFPDNKSRRQAFADGRLDGMYGLDPAFAARLEEQNRPVTTRQYNRVFAAFFNQDQNEILADKRVRQALAASVPKQAIVREALAGYGQIVNTPLPPSLAVTSGTSSQTSHRPDPENLLSAAGWATTSQGVRKKDGQLLEVGLTTADIPSLQKTANLLKQSWQKIGVKTSLQTLPANQLTRDVIRPRDYEILLFGQSVNNRRDLYSFWHSSRQDDPGLNLARYTNTDADALLETLRTATTSARTRQLTRDFLRELRVDQPAAFIFSPSFIMTTPENLSGLSLPPITHPSDRFADVSNWYLDTKLLWDIFVKDE